MVRPGGTSLYFRSGNGEYIGQGAAARLAAPDATVTTSVTTTGVVTVSVAEGSERWSVSLVAPTGQALVRDVPRRRTRPVPERWAPRAECLRRRPWLQRAHRVVHRRPDLVRRQRSAHDARRDVVAELRKRAAGDDWTGPGRRDQRPAGRRRWPATSQVGGATTLTATVAGSGTTPTGVVTFTDGGTTLGTVALDATGRAVLTTTLSRGGHSLGAAYGGSVRYAPSQATASLTVQGYASATSLSSNAKGSVKTGKPVQHVVGVTGAGAVPTGTVALYDGADQVATGVLSGGRVTVTWTPAARGTHTLTAGYLGDASHEPSVSPPLSLGSPDRQVTRPRPGRTSGSAARRPRWCRWA